MPRILKAFFKIELRALFREYISLFFMIVLPIILTMVFGGTFGAEATKYGENVLGIDTIVPVNIVFLIANAGLMGIPITILELKEQEVLKRYITYPITYKTYFISIILAFSFVTILSTLLFSTIAFVFYGASWYMNFTEILIFICIWLITVFIFYAIGFLIALLIKSSRTASIVSSGVFMIFLFTSGVALPVDSLPIYIQKLAFIFPMYHAIELFQMIWIGEFTIVDCGINLLYLIICSIVLYIILRRVKLKWD